MARDSHRIEGVGPGQGQRPAADSRPRTQPGGQPAWWPILASLSRSFRVIAPDLPGFGESEPLKDGPKPQKLVAWLADFIAESCDEPPVVVATSLGGAFGLRLAITRPERVAGLILADSQGLAPFRPPPSFMLGVLLSSLRPGPSTVNMVVRKVVYDQDHVRALHGPAWDALLDYMLSQARQRGVRRTMRRMASRANARPVPGELLEDLDSMEGLIWGRHDRPFPVMIAESASERFGWPLGVIEGAGHLPYIEKPSHFTEAVVALAGP